MRYFAFLLSSTLLLLSLTPVPAATSCIAEGPGDGFGGEEDICSFECGDNLQNELRVSIDANDPDAGVGVHGQCGSSIGCSGTASCYAEGIGEGFKSGVCTAVTVETINSGFTATCGAYVCSNLCAPDIDLDCILSTSCLTETLSRRVTITVDPEGTATGFVCNRADCEPREIPCVQNIGTLCGIGLSRSAMMFSLLEFEREHTVRAMS